MTNFPRKVPKWPHLCAAAAWLGPAWRSSTGQLFHIFHICVRHPPAEAGAALAFCQFFQKLFNIREKRITGQMLISKLAGRRKIKVKIHCNKAARSAPGQQVAAKVQVKWNSWCGLGLAAAPRGRDTGHVTRDKNTRPDTGHGAVLRSPCSVCD